MTTDLETLQSLRVQRVGDLILKMFCLKAKKTDTGKKKEKKFAWMDSDDESSSAASDASADKINEKKLTAAEVQSFSEMMRMAPEFQRQAKSMSLSGLSEVCAAAARVRFYDGGLIEALTAELQRHVNRLRPGTTFDWAAVVKTVVSFSELNAYNEKLFHSVAALIGTGSGLDQIDASARVQLLDAYRAVKHASDQAFVEALARRKKDDWYEEACREQKKRNLEQMFGSGELDLQGSAMDTERANLKASRTGPDPIVHSAAVRNLNSLTSWKMHNMARQQVGARPQGVLGNIPLMPAGGMGAMGVPSSMMGGPNSMMGGSITGGGITNPGLMGSPTFMTDAPGSMMEPGSTNSFGPF